MSRALWHMHGGTSLKEQMHFGLCWVFFFLFSGSTVAWPLVGFAVLLSVMGHA